MSLVKFNATDYSLLFQVFQFCIMKKKTEILYSSYTPGYSPQQEIGIICVCNAGLPKHHGS